MQLSSRYSVLHGFYGSAGQPGILSATLRETGVHAESIVAGQNTFGYENDVELPEDDRPTFRTVISEKFPAFDIIHVHSFVPFFAQKTVQFPMGVDLLAAKAMGKRVVVHLRGDDVEESPADISKRSPTPWLDSYLKMCFALADRVCVADPELQSYAPGAMILPRAIDLSEWTYVGPVNRKRPVIVHAPSGPAAKSTPGILAAIDTLRADGLEFDFQLVQGLPDDQTRGIYNKADIIVDELRIGRYGAVAVEGMALGKAVISHVRDDLLATFEDRAIPVAVASPDTMTDVLRALILDPDRRERQAAAGYAFCKSYHDRFVVAKRCTELYDEILANPRSIDIGSYMEVVAEQVTEAQKSAQASAGRPKGWRRYGKKAWATLKTLWKQRPV